MSNVTPEIQAILADIFVNSECPDKMSIKIRSDRSISIVYNDLDEEWLKEIKEAINHE